MPHERLGTFEAAFRDAGCSLLALHAYDTKAKWPVLAGGGERPQGLVVMGGPHSVSEQAKHPFLKKELALLEEALDAQLPILGVCLGAQLLAHALGAPVRKNPQKEIGWYPLRREPGADGDPLFEPFGQTETVFQWHGDTFALPRGAVRLASSPLCREQAFRCRENVYGLQFHLEVTEAMIRAWLRVPANREELAALRGATPPPRGGGTIDPLMIRRQSPRHVGRLQALSRHVAATFARFLIAQPERAARGMTHAGRH